MMYKQQEREPTEVFFEAIYEQHKNGNITEFKKRLGSMKGDEIYNFIKWLQAERLLL